LLDGDTHGGIFFAPQGDFEGVFHGHHLGGCDQGGAGVLEMLQGLGQADQQKMSVRMAGQKMAAGFQSDRWPVVSTHAIHSQGDHGIKAGWGPSKQGGVKYKSPCALRRTTGFGG
jgi:hypothetical protein